MKNNLGFTLVEMAIVLALIALILGSGLTVLSAQQDQRRIEETRTRLDEAHEALIGYAISHNRLPCPANPALADGVALAGEVSDCQKPMLGDIVLPIGSQPDMHAT